MTYAQDYSNAQNQQQLMQTMMQSVMQPQQRASAGSALGKLLSAYFLKQGIGRSTAKMGEATQGQEDSRKTDMANILSSYRGDTPYQMDESELFPGEAPIEGLKDIGTGQDRGAMIQAMMGASDPNLQNAGMKAMLAVPKVAGRMGKYNPGDFTPKSWAKFVSAGGGDASASLLERYEPPWMGKVGGVPSMVGRGTSQPGAVTPLGTLEAEVSGTEAIAGAKEEGKLEKQKLWKPQIESNIALAKSKAKERGEAFTDLSRAQAAMPGLEQTVGELKELAQIATYTVGGKAWDEIIKQTGFGATEGATARAKFIAIVNNQVLPLLKPTFGAAFTVAEGESLKATMGDPDKSPAEKMAELDAFIQQKYRTIQTKQRQLSPQAEDAIDMSTMSEEQLQAIISGE